MVCVDERVLRAAAFGADPDVADAVLGCAARSGPRQRWLAAVVLGARGDYARAAALLEPLLAGPDALTVSLAAAAVASHRRQLGGHADARRFDALALGAAARAAAAEHARPEAGQRGAPDDPDGVDVPGALADALLGLTADALAVGRQGEARVLLARLAGGTVAGVRPGASWRTRVRTGWVTAEVELAAGAAAAAVAPAAAAAELARERGAVRHTVKSEIVLAVALAGEGTEDGVRRARELVGGALATARHHRLDSLVWPAALVAADLDAAAAGGLRAEVRRVVYAVLRRSDPLGRELASLSPWVPVEVT